VLAFRPDGRTLDATVVDLGEGGIRAVLPPPGPIIVGSEIDVGVDLDGTWILLAAEVVRATARPDGLAELGLRFTHLERRLADTIRRHVFARQARERALGVAPA
jgi:c-di-GMP-binding flagellar brake protein YcgR